MVRETRYLWIGNLPEKVTEERISQHFERYGKIQSVKILSESKNDKPCATVAFMDIKSAAKAHNSENKVDGVPVDTEYYEPNATGTVTITRTHDSDSSQRGPGAPASSGAPSSSKVTNRTQPSSSTSYPTRSEAGSEDLRSHDYNYERRQNNYEEGEYERGRSKQRFPQAQVVRPNYSQRTQYDGREGRGQFESASSSLERAGSGAGNGGTVASTVTRTAKPSSQAVWGGGRSPARSCDSIPRSSRHGRRSTSRSPAGSRSSSASSSSRSSSRSSRSRSHSSKASRDHGLGGGTPTTSMSSVVTKKEPSNQNSDNKTGDRRDLGISIRGLPVRSSDTSLRDGLFHEYKKHGKVTSVNVFGSGDDRYAIVSFKKPEDAQKALEASQDKMFFGTRIQVETHEGFEVEDNEFKPPEAELDEYHPKATRTLFVGNLEKEISSQSLRDIFKPYGEIIDIDIKKQGAVSAYAFVQYSDICSVVKALRKMDGEHIGNNKIKLGFGKSMPTNCVWLDNVITSVNEKYLCRTFGRYGPVSHSVIDTVKGRALIYFENMDFAQTAVNEMRGRPIGGKKIQIDFASRDCQTAFFEKMVDTGQLRPGERPDERWKARVSRAGSTSNTSVKHHPGFEETDYDAKSSHSNKNYTYTNSSRSNYPQTRGARTNNNFRGQRASSRSANSTGTYYENYPEEYRRSGRSFDDYSAEGTNYLEDSFEQELRDYGYRQQERQGLTDSVSPQRRGSDSRSRMSPFSRGSRHPSPSHDRERYEDYPNERYGFRDSDSQSGEKESVRSFHSARSTERRFRDRSYDEQYTERYHDDKRQARGYSPASSEYSHKSRSPGCYRTSRSPSPVGKHKLKDRLGSPVQDYQYKGTPSRHSSPVDYDYKDPKWDGKRSSKDEVPKRDIRERCDSEERTSIAKLIGKPIATLELKSRKQKLDSEEDLSDPDKVKKLDIVPKRRSIEEREKLLDSRRDKTRPRSLSSGGSRVRLNDIDHAPSQPQDSAPSSSMSNATDSYRPKLGSAVTIADSKGKKEHKSRHKKSDKDQPYDPYDEYGPSGKSDSGSCSSSSSLESEEEGNVERGSATGSHSSADYLQTKRQHLLHKLKQLEDVKASGTLSDGDDDKKAKRARLEDMFDLSGRSPRMDALLKDAGKSGIDPARLKFEVACKHNTRLPDKKLLPSNPSDSKMEVDEEYHDSGAEKSPKDLLPKKRRKMEGPNATLLRKNKDDLFSGDEGDSHRLRDSNVSDKGENDHAETKRHVKHPPIQIKLDTDGSVELLKDPRLTTAIVKSIYYRGESMDAPVGSGCVKELPLTLPLPKWSLRHQWSTPAPPKESPKASLAVPATPIETQGQEATANTSKITSPPFSPGSKPYSPQDSPLLKASESPAEGKEDKDKPPPPPPPLPPMPPPSDSDNKENTKAGDQNLSSPSLKLDSDSELSDPGSPSRNIDGKSLEERLKALDAMMMVGTKVTPPPPPSTTSSDYYREKYRVRKRVDTSVTNNVIGGYSLPQIRSEPSHIVKSIMLKKSILDQDSKRLEKRNDPAVDGVPEDGRFIGLYRGGINKEMPPPLSSSLSSSSFPLISNSLPTTPASAPPFHTTPSTAIGVGVSDSLTSLTPTTNNLTLNLTSITSTISSAPLGTPLSAPAAITSSTSMLGLPSPGLHSSGLHSPGLHSPTLHSPQAKLSDCPRPGILIHRQSIDNKSGVTGLPIQDPRRDSVSQDPRRDSVSQDHRRDSLSQDPRRDSVSQDPRRDSVVSQGAQDPRRDSVSSLSSDTSVPPTPTVHPVSILKKQESSESTSSSTQSSTPSTPHTPQTKSQPSLAGPATPAKDNTQNKDIKKDTMPSSSSGLLGKRKLEDKTDKTAATKSDTKLDKPKGAISKPDSSKSDKSEEPESKKAKTTNKEHKKTDKTDLFSTSTSKAHKEIKKSSSTSKHSKSPEKKSSDKKDHKDDKSRHIDKSNHSKSKPDQDKDNESVKSGDSNKTECDEKEIKVKESSSSPSTQSKHKKETETKSDKSKSSTKDKSKSKSSEVKPNRTVTSQTVSETSRPDATRLDTKVENKAKPDNDKHKSDKHKHSSDKHDRARSDSVDRSKKDKSEVKDKSEAKDKPEPKDKTEAKDKMDHKVKTDKKVDKHSNKDKTTEKKKPEDKKQEDRKKQDKKEERLKDDKKKQSKEDKKEKEEKEKREKEKEKEKEKEREKEEKEKAVKDKEKEDEKALWKFEEDMMFPSMYDMVKARRKSRDPKEDESQRKVEEKKKKSFDKLQERRRKTSKTQKSDERDSSAHNTDEDSMSSPVREPPKPKKKKESKTKKNTWILDSTSEDEDDKVEKKKSTKTKVNSKPRVETSMESEEIEDIEPKPKKKGKKKTKQLSIPSDTEDDDKQVIKEKETTECQKLEKVPPGQRYKMIFSSDDDEEDKKTPPSFAKLAAKKDTPLKNTFPEFSDELSEDDLPTIKSPKNRKKLVRKKLLSESTEDDIEPVGKVTPKPNKTKETKIPKEKKVEKKAMPKDEEKEEKDNTPMNKTKKAKHKDKKKPNEDTKTEEKQENKKDHDDIFGKEKKPKKEKKDKDRKVVEEKVEDKSDDRPMPTLTNESPCDPMPPLSMPDLDMNLSNLSFEFDSGQENNGETFSKVPEIPNSEEKAASFNKTKEDNDRKEKKKEHKSKREKNIVIETPDIAKELDLEIKKDDDEKLRKDGQKKKKLKKKKKSLTDENEEKRDFSEKDDFQSKFSESSIWRSDYRDNIFDMMNRKEEHINVSRGSEEVQLKSPKHEIKSPKHEIKSPPHEVKSPLAELKQSKHEMRSPKHVLSETLYEGDESEKFKKDDSYAHDLKTSPICSDEDEVDDLMLKPPSIEEILAKEAAEKEQKERERAAARREISERETEAAVAAVEHLLQFDSTPRSAVVHIPEAEESFNQEQDENEEKEDKKSDMCEEEKAVLALAKMAELQDQEPEEVSKPVAPGHIPPPSLPEEEDSLPESTLCIAEPEEVPEPIEQKVEPEPIPVPKLEESDHEVVKTPARKGKGKKQRKKAEEPPQPIPEELKEKKLEKSQPDKGDREPSVNEDELMAAICSILPGEESSPAAPPTPQTASTDLEDSMKSPVLPDVKSPSLHTPELKLDKLHKLPDNLALKSPTRRDSGIKTPRRLSIDEPLITPPRPEAELVKEPLKEPEEKPVESQKITSPRRFTESPAAKRNSLELSPFEKRSVDESPVCKVNSVESPVAKRNSVDSSPVGKRNPMDASPIGKRKPMEPPIAKRNFMEESPLGKRNSMDESPAGKRNSMDESPAGKHNSMVESPAGKCNSMDESPVGKSNSLDESPVAKVPEMKLHTEIPDPCHQPDDDGDEALEDVDDEPQPETPQPETPEKKEETPRRGRKGKKNQPEEEEDETPAPVRSSPRSRGRLDLSNDNSQERFSSRGRKIIPKERDDELTGFSGPRKTRQQTQAESPRGRGRRAGVVTHEEGVKPRRGRRGSLKQTDVDDIERDEEEMHEEDTNEDFGSRGRGTLRRRRGGRGRNNSNSRNVETHEDSREEDESKDSYDDKLETSGDTDLDVQVDSPRTRRSRRGKGKRLSETGSVSPRTRSADGSISPRGKLVDGGATSPKASELSRPFVKLEKLKFPEVRQDEKKEEDKETVTASRFSLNRFGAKHTENEKLESKTGKDLYEWEDDDEKPPPVSLHTQRPKNKRKIGEWESPRKPVPVEDITQDSSSSIMEEKFEERKVEEKVDKPEKLPEKSEKLEKLPEKVKDDKLEIKFDEIKRITEEKPKEKFIATEAKVEEKVEIKEKIEKLQKKENPFVEEKKVEEKKVEEKKPEAKKLPPDVPDLNDTFIPASMSGARTAADDFQNHPAMTPLNILVPTSVGEMPRITVPPDSRPQSGHNSPTETHHLLPKLEFKKEKDDPSKSLLGSPRPAPQQTITSNLDRVIDEVARGHFSIPGESPVSPSPPLANKKRHSRSRSREDVHSPRSITGGVPSTVNSTSPTVASPPTQAMPPLLGAPQVAFPQDVNKIMGHGPHIPVPHQPRGPAPQFPDAKQPPAPAMARMPQPPGATPTSVIQSLHSNTVPSTMAGPIHRPGYLTSMGGNHPGASVHVGVVSDPYNINQRDSPQGQVIEIVPNPNIRSPTRHEQEKHSDGHHPPAGHRPQGQGHHPPAQGHQGHAPTQGQGHQSQVHPVHQGQGHSTSQGQGHHHPGHKGHQVPSSHGPQGQSPKDAPSSKAHGVQQVPHPPHGAMHPHYPPHSSQHYPTPGVMVSQGATTTVSPSTTQTSELRAALARGRGDASKMVHQQQEQIRKQPPQQAPQQMMGLRPPPNHPQERQSPGVMGHPRMGYPFPDLPRQGARLEAKTSPGADPKVPPTAPVFAGEHGRGPGSAFSQPDLRMPHPENRPGSLPPDARGLPPQLYGEMRFPHPGLAYPPHIIARMDPRMMFPHAQFSPDLFHQGAPSPHMIPGMVPQQQFIPGHPQGSPLEGHPALDRPPSAARPPSAQASPAAPSPRATPTPVSTPLPSPMLPHPAAMPRNLMHMPLPEDSLYHILQRFPIMWQGTLALKNESAMVQMHALSGSHGLIKSALMSNSNPLRIAQRMRLEPTQLDGVTKKMQNNDEYSMLLALPCGRDHVDLGTQIKNLRSGLINYLSSKQAAGIVNVAAPGTEVTSTPQPAFVIHIFPPCEFSQANLSQLAPELLHSLGDMAHMLIIIATV